MNLQTIQLTGQTDTHLQRDNAGTGLQPACWQAFYQLQAAAAEAGYDLQVASGFRSFDRQLKIWNDKASGVRPVSDDDGAVLAREVFSELEWMHAILRFSALPGGSRHHWGTDLDVFDAAAVPPDYRLQLSPAEVADDGPFGPMHRWIDQRLQKSDCFGFSRPYAVDHGGVACERWHLSYLPLAQGCEAQLTESLLREVLDAAELQLGALVAQNLPEIYRRYLQTGGR
ncbi:D-alanyl-D-alanine carboxypeptidase family protein [Halieaceae bacterium IMCC14734]|uniref:D-alanyl-D-alanine carboxypeptidase family protein n=1 Tax=Candidatus Litorirhabdus singularis TaxID=2518993 RepID=A0ABT3TLC0_9GAMM|nr:M15 family metallopeptidase [Candidatus Litorirhabdus singularis]MCX2983093.1 D-alanyl-D-alanine carboxypeptidase family protein [Candidatus Litorirhabdus singularis]